MSFFCCIPRRIAVHTFTKKGEWRMVKREAGNQLRDIRDLSVDVARPAAERIAQYCAEIQDPYRFCVGDVCVRIAFSEQGGMLADRLCAALTQYGG